MQNDSRRRGGDGHIAAYRRTSKIQAHPKAGAPGVSTASARSFAALARAESRGDRRGAQRRRLLVYPAPSSCTPRRTTPGPRWGYATARLGLRAPIAAEDLGSTATTTGRDPHPRSRPRTRHRLRLAGAVPFPPLAGGSAAPLSTAALLSTLEIGLGPSAARPLRRGAGRPVPNTISSGGGLAEGNGSAFNWLSRARRAPSDFPSPVAPPPSCELVAPRGAETRERRPEPGLPSQVRDWSRGVPAPG